MLKSKEGVLLSDILMGWSETAEREAELQNSEQALKDSEEVRRFTSTGVHLRG